MSPAPADGGRRSRRGFAYQDAITLLDCLDMHEGMWARVSWEDLEDIVCTDGDAPVYRQVKTIEEAGKRHSIADVCRPDIAKKPESSHLGKLFLGKPLPDDTRFTFIVNESPQSDLHSFVVERGQARGVIPPLITADIVNRLKGVALPDGRDIGWCVDRLEVLVEGRTIDQVEDRALRRLGPIVGKSLGQPPLITEVEEVLVWLGVRIARDALAPRPRAVDAAEFHQMLQEAIAKATGRRPDGSTAPLATLTDKLALTGIVGSLDLPRPLAGWQPERLGVHAAIADPLQTTATGFVLPEYIARRHDHELRDLLTDAASGEEPVLLVLSGHSCTGKTRTAYEAVAACLADWELAYPKDADSLCRLLAADVLGPRTVLWLNEAQELLGGHGGEAAAAALRRRLERPGPLVVIATLWPGHRHELTDRPVGVRDRHPQARALLAAARVITVPTVFDGSVLRRLHETDDGSLAVAARTAPDGSITQTLAGGPALVQWYEQADGAQDCYGKAVVSAAMDARRLGHTSPLPLALLEMAAPGYLTDAQRAAAPAGWFETAMVFARTRIKDVVAALGDVAHDHGMGAQPGVCRLADYLDHYSRTARHAFFPPTSFWQAVEYHAATAADLYELARSAEHRGRLRLAATLLRRAADGGHGPAWTAIVSMMAYRDLTDEAEVLARSVLQKGDPEPILTLAWTLNEFGHPDETERLVREAVTTGHASALTSLATVLSNGPEAEESLTKAVALGSPEAPFILAELRRNEGDLAEYERLLWSGALAGDRDARGELVSLKCQADEWEEAERLARSFAEGSDGSELAMMAMQRIDDRTEAERLAWAVVELADRNVLDTGAQRWQGGTFAAAMTLVGHADDEAGAETVLNRLAEFRNPQTWAVAAWHLEGRNPGWAEALYRRAAERGDLYALERLAMMERHRNAVGAERTHRAAVDAGCGVGPLAALWEAEGRAEVAEQARCYGLEVDGSIAEPWLF
ncbi:dsDNA nuclease domain-containing protein [Kitasatospora sp. NPDC006786]|uniref:dsDNA nuclease domain-containing protein n=1 Tax=unclassified Kitasatospora TaxID=2633591 RepID=UPI0033F9FCCE